MDIERFAKAAGNMSKGENGFEEHVTAFAMAHPELKDRIKEKYSAGTPVQRDFCENGEEYIMTEEDEIQKKFAMAYEKTISEENLEAIKERLENRDNTKDCALNFGLDRNWPGIINSLYRSD